MGMRIGFSLFIHTLVLGLGVQVWAVDLETTEFDLVENSSEIDEVARELENVDSFVVTGPELGIQPKQEESIVLESEKLGEVLWVLAPSSKQIEAVKVETSPSQIMSHSEAANKPSKMINEPEFRMKKDEGKIMLPAAAHKLSDKNLRKLCEGLTESNTHAQETISNSRLQNFSVKSPLVLRVGQMKTLSNVQAEYVVIVPTKGKAPEIGLLKDIKKPYVLCGVKARRLESVNSPVIFVGVKAPKLPKKNRQIRSIEGPKVSSVSSSLNQL